MDALTLFLAAHIGLVLLALLAVLHGADTRDGFAR
jgi:hypothetical protein